MKNFHDKSEFGGLIKAEHLEKKTEFLPILVLKIEMIHQNHKMIILSESNILSHVIVKLPNLLKIMNWGLNYLKISIFSNIFPNRIPKILSYRLKFDIFDNIIELLHFELYLSLCNLENSFLFDRNIISRLFHSILSITQILLFHDIN